MEDKMPFHTCPVATSMISGMTGLVKMRSRSNCIALAAACRAFTCSLWDHVTIFQRPSGIGFGFSWPLAVTGAPELSSVAFTSSFTSSLFLVSLSSLLSFFFRCRRWFRSLSLSNLMLAVLGCCGSVFFSSPETGGSSVFLLCCSSCLSCPRSESRKTKIRMNGRKKKLTTVGIGPMTTVVMKPRTKRRMPIRHRYPPNCRRSL
mmetsp:Transcript_10391/g.25029  ORF Transcript_10391/g.25029 Transcript_10391/m.25029 type:complete len:204 (+) Transcript_10391:869-1480(+)